MSKSKGNYRHKRGGKASVGRQAKEVLENIDKDNPVLQMFHEFSLELDDKHDRYERVLKQSRDVTIESKRIIFLLHNSDTDIDVRRDSILAEALIRLTNLWSKNFKIIATELVGQDQYQYHRAFTPGIQEFIEAACFYHYQKHKELPSWEELNKNFQYENEGTNFELLFTPMDFMLGITDFTGELMRKCINSLGVGNTNDCFDLCNFVRYINTGFLGLFLAGNREISRKKIVLKQSLAKMELVCYNIQIRGSEIPKHMLVSVIESNDNDNDIDEGFGY